MHRCILDLLNNHSSTEYLSALSKAGQAIKQWLDADNIYQLGLPEHVQSAVNVSIASEGRDFDAIMKDIKSAFLPGCVSTAHRRCLAHLHPPTLIISQVAELLIAASNQSMDSWNQSPSATHIEQELVRWLTGQCGFIDAPAGVFTSGGTQSNLMGLLLARNTFYAKRGIDVHKDGVADAPRGVIFCSDQAHFSIQKNAALIGLGQKSVVKVKTNRAGAMCVQSLEEHITRVGSNNVIAVVATAGTTDAGAIDPLSHIGQICTQYNIWLHIDAAWGGALLLSHKYQHLISGIDYADSITLDFHKHFFLPSSCGAFLVKDASHYESIRYHSEYLNSQEDNSDNIPNLVTYSLQTTRRFDALKLWMALDYLGTKKYGELIDCCIDCASESANVIKRSDNFTLANRPALSSILFYFDPPTRQLSTQQLASVNRRIAQALLVKNQANIATTTYKGQFCLKFTILNPDTTPDDIEEILKDISVCGIQLLNEQGIQHHDVTQHA